MPRLVRGASGLHDPRTRGDASRDAALHRSPTRVRSQAPQLPGGTKMMRFRRARCAASQRAGQRSAPIPMRLPFGWDNEFQRTEVDVPAFDMSAYPVTNSEWLRFVARRRSGTALLARTGWRVASASALRGDSFTAIVARLRYPRASASVRAAGPECGCRQKPSTIARLSARRQATSVAFPWGDDPPDARHGNFGFERFDPEPVDAHPDGTSAWGIVDLIGNGWEWTATPFAPLPGFEPMASYPQYSADFFDGKHYVMKGASPVTPRELIRRSFRNWFYDDYPYMYAKFRCVAP